MYQIQAHQGVSYGGLNIIDHFSRFYPQTCTVVPNVFLQSAECMVDARSQFVSVHTCNCMCYTDSWVKEQSKPILPYTWCKTGEHSQSFVQYNSLYESLLQAAVSLCFWAWMWWDEFHFPGMADNRREATTGRFWKGEQRQPLLWKSITPCP